MLHTEQFSSHAGGLQTIKQAGSFTTLTFAVLPTPWCCGKARTNFPNRGYNWGEKITKWVLGVAMVTLRLDLLRKNRRLQ